MTIFLIYLLGKKDIYLETQHPTGEAGLDKVQETEMSIAERYARRPSVPGPDYGKPVFIVPLKPHYMLEEGQPLHMECQVEPKEDPKLEIEWFVNGKELDKGGWLDKNAK